MYLQNNKKTDKVKAAQKVLQSTQSFLYTFWRVFIELNETPCVLGLKHTLPFPLVEPLCAKPKIKERSRTPVHGCFVERVGAHSPISFKQTFFKA